MPVHLAGDYLDWLLARGEQGLGVHVVTLNAEMTMLAKEEPRLAELIQRAELVVPDGSGVVWALNKSKRTEIQVARCPGIELVTNLLPGAGKRHWRVYLIGAAPGLVKALAPEWEKKYSGLQIVGTQDGYFTAEQEAEIQAHIAQTNPHLILLGLGVPKQEFTIQRWRDAAPQALWIGVGGSFDVWTGTKERAPQWFRDNNLEWAYRLYREPWRWRRMLALPRFAWHVLRSGVSS
jgi:N-acetylglucosaminyldiphosphoundecaprenol N-acetyl-beta-D-mannosaminyltransferase